MLYALLIPLLLAAARAAGAGPPLYEAGDPLGAGRAPEVVYRVAESAGGPPAPLLRAIVAEGYRRVDGKLTSPVIAMFTQEVYGGEAAIVVERYTKDDGNGIDRDAFVRRLTPQERQPAASRHGIGGKDYAVHHGLEFTRFTRRISPGDPYSDYLGTRYRPPRLSFLERRRFLTGGEAYRLYRCRRLDAWGLLGDYRRMRRKQRLDYFREKLLGSTERKIIAACFGRAVIMDVVRGDAVPKIPKPSMYRLRIMAREERAHDAVSLVERECVHLRDIPGGFLVLRYRAPRARFKEEHAAFAAFLASFVYFN